MILHRFMKHKYSITVRTFILILKIQNRATKSHQTNWLNRNSLEHSHCMPNFANLRIYSHDTVYLSNIIYAKTHALTNYNNAVRAHNTRGKTNLKSTPIQMGKKSKSKPKQRVYADSKSIIYSRKI